MRKFEKRIFIFCIALLSILILFRNLSWIDEIYNYNFGRNIIYGNIIYKDFNAVIFPTFPLLISLFLKIFGNELIVYRFFQLSIYIGIVIYSFKLLEKLKLNKLIRNYIIFVMYISVMAFYTIAEYNLFCLFIILILLNLEFKNNTVKSNFLIGILVGISVTVKQSVGIVVGVISILVLLFDKTDFKCKKIFFRIIGIIIPIAIMFCYLWLNNNIYEWFDLTILGLIEFGNNNKYTYFQFCVEEDYLLVLASIIIILLFVIALFKFIKNFSKTKDEIGAKLIIYSLAMLVVMYPIANGYHVLISLYLILFDIVYIFKKEDVFEELNENILKRFVVIIDIAIGILIIILLLSVINVKNSKQYKHYKYINMEDDVKSNLDNITNFINKNKNVYFLDNFGVFYMIPNDEYRGFFELPLSGNAGKNGEEYYLNKIKELNDVYLLISEVERPQILKNEVKYIEENYEKVGEINEYNIYYINN